MVASGSPGSPAAPGWEFPVPGGSSFPRPGPSGRTPSVFVGRPGQSPHRLRVLDKRWGARKTRLLCVWLLIKAGRAWELRGNHVRGVGLLYWGAQGYPPVPMGSTLGSPQHVGEHYIAMPLVPAFR